MRRVYVARRRVLGKEHPLTLTSAGTLASSLYHQGGGGGAACDARARGDEGAERADWPDWPEGPRGQRSKKEQDQER